MIKIALRYAVFCGAFLFLIFLLLDLFGNEPLLNLNQLFLDLAIFSIFIFFAIREYKVYYNDTILHYWQGLNIGIVVLLVSAVISTILLMLYIGLQDGYIEHYKEALALRTDDSKEKLIEQFGQDGFDAIKENIQAMTFVKILVTGISPPSVLLKKILAGFFVTPIVSIILRKKPT